MLPENLNNLIYSFKYLPGIGEKTAERLAFSVLNLDLEQVEFFANNLEQVKKNIHKCKICNSLTDQEICSICLNKLRDDSVLCVLDDAKNVFLFEKMGIFNGKYHVLDGLISPLDGINPEDIGIEKLLDRVKNENFREIIFALKPSIEGETTSLYIKKILSDENIVFSRLASGLPIGADIEYVDNLTLEKALNERKSIE